MSLLRRIPVDGERKPLPKKSLMLEVTATDMFGVTTDRCVVPIFCLSIFEAIVAQISGGSSLVVNEVIDYIPNIILCLIWSLHQRNRQYTAVGLYMHGHR